MENLTEKPIRGLFRPDAYISGVKPKYCTQLQIDNVPAEIQMNEQVVLNAVLLHPVGFGDNLKEGVMLILKNGIYPVGKAIVLEIIPF